MRLLLSLLLAFLSAPASAQSRESSQPTRPKIGLVLGGGGALGLSHVGVIQRLEEEGIYPDIVVGTSIGAVVGAMYTSGYQPDELSVLAEDLDWENMFDDASHRSRLNFRRKQDDDNFPARFKIGVNRDGLQLPKGVIQGQKLFFELTRLINAKNSGARFTNLDRPFRAIATDLENKEPVVLGDGDLTRAVFASMSVPGILPPVQIGDQLLVDGGLANNLPISIARQMGADIIIAVDLSRPPKRAEEIENVFDVVSQLAAFITLEQSEQELASLTDIDILIKPDLEGFSPISFEKGAALTMRGRAAVAPVLEQLQALAASVTTKPPPLVSTRGQQTVLAAIHLQNQTNTSDDLIWSNLQVRAGDPFDEAMLAQNITDLYGYDLFGRIDYRLEERDDGTHLTLSLQEPGVGDDFLRFGFSLQSNFENKGGFNAQTSYTRRNLNPLGAEWRSVLRIGNNPMTSTEWYQPVNARQTQFLSAKAVLSRDRFSLFDQQNIALGELRLDAASLELAYGMTLGKWGEVRIGAEQNWLRIDRSVGFPGFSKQSQGVTELFAQMELDTFDRLDFPTSGWSAKFRGDTSISGDFDAFEDRTFVFGVTKAVPLAGGTLLPHIEAGIALDEEQGGIGSQSLGGFLQLSGLPPNSRLGNHAALGSLIWYRSVTDTTGLISYPLYIGFSLEAGNVFARRKDISFSNLTKAGSLFIGAPTPIGPVYLATGLTEDGKSALYLFVGQTF